MAQGHSVDEYLETIYFLAFPIGEYRPQSSGAPTLAARVAEMLGVSRASAGEMLKRLEGEGLVERGEHKEAILTPSGRERAERVVRRHRLVERLLTDFMGYTAAEAHVYADEIGESFSDDMIERIDERLGHPERCPHGWPLDTEAEQAENRELAPLAELVEHQAEDRVRVALGPPVLGVDVGEDGLEAELLDDRQLARVRVEAGRTEEPRRRAEDFLDCVLTALDLPAHLALLDLGQARMREGVAPKLVALTDDPLYEVRVLADALADHEEGRARLVVAQEIEHERGPARGTVVEGERDRLQTARTKSPAAAFSLIARSSPFTRTVSCSAAG